MIRKVHHVAVVVRSVDEALKFYRDALGLTVTESATVSEQGVKAVLLGLGEDELELIEPLDSQSGVGRYLDKRGEGVHHICFETDDIEVEMERARAAGVRLVDSRPRRGLAGEVCFVHPSATGGVLVELAQPEKSRP